MLDSNKLEGQRGATYLVGNLELLASTDVLGLGNGGLEAVESLGVKSLKCEGKGKRKGQRLSTYLPTSDRGCQQARIKFSVVVCIKGNIPER